MLRFIVVLFMLVLITSATANALLARTWTDRKGRQVEAEFVASADGKVSLKRSSDGKVFQIPLELLSDADQAFVKKTLPARAKTDPNVEAGAPEVIMGIVVADNVEEWKTSKGEFLLHVRCKVTTRQPRITMGAAKGKLDDSDLATFEDFRLTLPDKTAVTAIGVGTSETLWRAPNGYGNFVRFKKLDKYDWDVNVVFVLPKGTRSADFQFGEAKPVSIAIPEELEKE